MSIEVWMRGPLNGVPPLLQPVAHTLLQAQEEIHVLLENFPDALLWERPFRVASVAFHLQHIAGVIDRLFTYAAGQPLTEQQLEYLANEGMQNESVSVASLLSALDARIERTMEIIKHTDEQKLTEPRGVGRKQLPSTVMGLYFHAAEHTMRHTGQLSVTIRTLK
jgi:uncharacterized damage-inducible protein DinB